MDRLAFLSRTRRETEEKPALNEADGGPVPPLSTPGRQMTSSHEIYFRAASLPIASIPLKRAEENELSAS